MYEVRFHGRGGQGAVMAAQALADAAFIEGNYAVAFPFFGAERRGAPVLAFARVDKGKIYEKTQVYEPDYVVVLDDKLPLMVDVTKGLKDTGMAIINTSLKPEEVELGRAVKTATVDATGVALEVLGTPITNSAILGAFAKATGVVSIESIKKGIMDIFGARIGERLAEKNARAAEVAYERTSVGICKGTLIYPEEKKWLPTAQEFPTGGALGLEVKTDAGLIGLGSFVENKTGSWRTFMPVADNSKCVNCKLCWFYCPEGAIEMLMNLPESEIPAGTGTDPKGNPKGIKIDYDYCKGCGICANECPTKAITMER